MQLEKSPVLNKLTNFINRIFSAVFMQKIYDIIVIGSGAGLNIARNASSNGFKTAFIEKGRLGGTCLNRGCIPSKMLIYPSETADRIRAAAKLDISVSNKVKVEFNRLIKRINENTAAISNEILTSVKEKENLDFYHDNACFISDRVIKVGDDELKADKIFIGTGSKPLIPDIPGLKDTDYMTSTDALNREELPKSLIVIGAGYIAAELGYAYRACGCKVDFVVRSRFLRKEDDDISEEFQRVFSKNHNIHQGWHPVQVNKVGEMFNLECIDGDGNKKILSAEELLVSVGVVPETDGLGLDNTEVKLDEEGNIKVDDCLHTDVPGIFAFGDVVGNFFFRHTANYEAKYLTNTQILGNSEGPIDYGPVPHAVFSFPEIAGVGLTEQQALDSGTDYITGTARYQDSTPGLARQSDHGLVKLIFNRYTKTLLGAHIVGDDAATMIHMFIAFMKMHGTMDDILDTIFIHPALPEVAKEAVLDARGRF
jgi:dihydrolipoamide dehydrogenase